VSASTNTSFSMRAARSASRPRVGEQGDEREILGAIGVGLGAARFEVSERAPVGATTAASASARTPRLGAEAR